MSLHRLWIGKVKKKTELSDNACGVARALMTPGIGKLLKTLWKKL